MSSVASNDNAGHNTERLLVNSSGGPFIVSQQSSPASSAQSSPSCAGKRSAGNIVALRTQNERGEATVQEKSELIPEIGV